MVDIRNNTSQHSTIQKKTVLTAESVAFEVFPNNQDINESRSFLSPIDPSFVHKKNPNNVLISHPVQLATDKFRSKVFSQTDNLFLFDHAYDHLPGLLLIEAGRQIGTAVTHIHYGIPLNEYHFILENVSLDFVHMAKIEEVHYADITVEILKEKNSIPRRFLGQGFIHNNSQIKVKMESRWTLIRKASI